MKQFQFRLQKVMELKEEIEKQRMMELGEAKMVVAQEEQRLHELHQQDKRYRAEIKEKESEEVIDPVEIDSYYRYLKQLEAAMETQAYRIQQAKVVEEEKRENLLAATKERKILEKLRERKLNDFMIDLARKEQFVLDDLANTSFVRRRLEN